ncbi:extracellular matrix protein 2 isoform X2 [Oryzias melastigma]|uniref:Extracellular matrix protein 2 n=1 Tax=Oryzias melastigma TaxID=30732 RepID=A0A3B3D2S1_ORYME|nr:extracellular matrix protein 2 isoform X2 [Oryzias melastigma]
MSRSSNRVVQTDSRCEEEEEDKPRVSRGMRWWLLVASLSVTVVLTIPDAQAGGRPLSSDGESQRGKRKRDRSGHGRSRGGPRPLKMRLVPGPNVPAELMEKQKHGGSVNKRNIQELQLIYSVIPVPNNPNEATPLLTQEEIQRILWREEEEHQEEEEQLRKKEEARKKRRRERKEREEKQKEERRREEEALRLQVEKEEEEWRREVKEREDKRMQEEKMREEKEREKKEKERMREQEAKQEEEVWLRGDVFQMTPKEVDLPSRPPTAGGEEEENRGALPPGCDISDVTMTCENARLAHFPPLSIPELKSLSLEGNNISSIPAQAFNGIPNLEWINLRKNRLTSAGIDADAFKGLKMLRRLYLDGNLLESVPSDLPSTLQELKINENRLRAVDETSFQDMSSLMILELEGNLLSEGNVDPLAFAPLSQLSYLRLGKNHFRTVPQGLPKSLLELHLENNLIEEISATVFNQTTNLNVVSLRHNKLDETRIAPMAWINLRNLESIDLSHNEFYLVPSFLPTSLVHLVLVGNKIERIPGYVFAHMSPGLEYLYLSYNKLDGEGTEPESFVGTYTSMVEMCLDHNQLINVPAGINEMMALHFLRLDNNMIRSVPDHSICDPDSSGENTLVALRLENNFINSNKISPTAFSCIRSASSVVLKPQKVKH